MGVDAEYPTQMLGGAWKSCWEGRGMIGGTTGVRGTVWKRAQRTESIDQDSWELECQGTVGVWPRSFTYIVMSQWLGVFVGILTVGTGTVHDSCLLVGPFPPYWVPLSNLDVIVCAWSQCRVLCMPCSVDVPGRPAVFCSQGWGT